MTSYEAGTVLVIDLLQKELVGLPITAELSPFALALNPDGSRLYAVNSESDSVSVIDVASRQTVGPPIEVGAVPRGIAISPDGLFAYVANYWGASVSVIDTQINQVISEIPVNEYPEGITFSPDGRKAYVTSQFPGRVQIIDTQARQVVGGPVEIGGTQAGDIAVVPNQAPVASFSSPPFRPAVADGLDGSRSTDPEVQPLRFDWNFGDGQVATDAGATPQHAYASQGTYEATLTVTDSEGCSTGLIFTGHTAYCNGSPRASQKQAIGVAFPVVRISCPVWAKRPCRYRLRVVATKKKKSKTLSALVRVKVKPGASKAVTIKPKPRFAKRLASAKTLLVRGIRLTGRKRVSFVRQLPVVR